MWKVLCSAVAFSLLARGHAASCLGQRITVYITSPATQISLDGTIVADLAGYVAYVTDPATRVADYLVRDEEGRLLVESPTGRIAAPVSPGVQSLFQTDERDGSLFLALSRVSPLFRQPPSAGAASYTFRYTIVPAAESADQRVLIDPQGNVLWRPGEPCIAGQIFARFGTSFIPSGLEYSILGGTTPLGILNPEEPASQMIQTGFLGHGGSLMARWWNVATLSNPRALDDCPEEPMPPTIPSPPTPDTLESHDE